MEDTLMTTPDDPYALMPDTLMPDALMPDALMPDADLSGSEMAPGSDAGEPGGHLGPGDLDPEEERLLAALERDAAARQAPAEENFVVMPAVEHEAPLPDQGGLQGGLQDDGLTPLFSSPGEA
jgi:hypothetical protein